MSVMSLGGLECPYLPTLVVSILESQTPPVETAEQQPYAWNNMQKVGQCGHTVRAY